MKLNSVAIVLFLVICISIATTASYILADNEDTDLNTDLLSVRTLKQSCYER